MGNLIGNRARPWLLAATCAALAAAPALHAQSAVDLQVVPFVGTTLFMSDLPERLLIEGSSGASHVVNAPSFDQAFAAGVVAGTRLRGRWGIEGTLGWSPATIDGTGAPENPDVDIWVYGLSGVFYVNPTRRFGPHLGLSLGAQTYDWADAGLKHHTDLQGGLFGGFTLSLGSGVFARMEVRELLTHVESGIDGVDDELNLNTMPWIGLGFSKRVR